MLSSVLFSSVTQFLEFFDVDRSVGNNDRDVVSVVVAERAVGIDLERMVEVENALPVVVNNPELASEGCGNGNVMRGSVGGVDNPGADGSIASGDDGTVEWPCRNTGRPG